MTKVVLVEDEAIVRKGISLSVNWEEYGVEIADEAANGEEALQKCLACRPEIVITDIRMPQMDGLELAEKLKGLLPEVKIIILSGYEDFEYAKRALVLGVNEYLLKPVNEEELVTAVKNLQKRIETEREQVQSRKSSEYLLNENLMTIQSKFFRQIFKGERKERGEELLAEAMKRKIDLRGKRYRVFLMRVDQKPVWDEHEQKGNRDLYQFAVCNIGEEILKEKMGKGTLVFYEGIDFAGILCMGNLERFSIVNILEEIQCKIRDYCLYNGVKTLAF